MKKLFLLLLFALFCLNGVAQDLIVKNDGSVVKCKVAEIKETSISYKKWSNLNGPLYNIAISEIVSINFENGEIEYFKKEDKKGPVASIPASSYVPAPSAQGHQNAPTQGMTVPSPNSTNATSSSLYLFDEKAHLLDQAKTRRKTANILNGVALPIGLIVGLGGAFLIKPFFIWIGLGMEVATLVISGCIRSSAGKLERKANMLYKVGQNEFKSGKNKFVASVGLIDNGNFGLLINF